MSRIKLPLSHYINTMQMSGFDNQILFSLFDPIHWFFEEEKLNNIQNTVVDLRMHSITI